METLLAICAGLGLSAACGFRVFVPMLIMSIAVHAGHLHVSPGFAWIGSTPAIVAFSLATALEIGGYYIPWLDHFLDTVSTPAAVVAGTIVTASMITDVSPFLRWTLAVIAGGGLAGAVQGTTVLARIASTAATGGLGNPLLATLELGGSVFGSLAAVIAPFVAIMLVMGVVAFLIVRALRKRNAARSMATPPPTPAAV
jgi:hypothetical protein